MKRDKRWKPESADYYDDAFRCHLSNDVAIARGKVALGQIACHTQGSVLDLGCGMGYLADMIDDRDYYGLDFSGFAIKWASKHTLNPNAQFRVADLRTLGLGKLFDTVVLVEVLEHLEMPEAVAKLALSAARQRVVVTVPSRRGGQRAHVWNDWTCRDLVDLFGDLAICRVISRGLDLLAVHEIVGERKETDS